MMWIDQRGSEVFTRNECLRLALGAGGVGRIGMVAVDDNVLIEPVNYRMLDGDVLVQVGPGSILDAATENRIVSFEVDELRRRRDKRGALFGCRRRAAGRGRVRFQC